VELWHFSQNIATILPVLLANHFFHGQTVVEGGAVNFATIYGFSSHIKFNYQFIYLLDVRKKTANHSGKNWHSAQIVY